MVMGNPTKGGAAPATVNTGTPAVAALPMAVANAQAPATATNGNLLSSVGNGIQTGLDKLQEPYNKMTDAQKKRFDTFNKMAMSQPQQAQFSPVQFGGAGDSSLLALVQEMKKRGL